MSKGISNLKKKYDKRFGNEKVVMLNMFGDLEVWDHPLDFVAGEPAKGVGRMLEILLREMLRNAAEEIGEHFSEDYLDSVLSDLRGNEDISLDNDSPVTWQVMREMSRAVGDWQAETLKNL